MIAKFHSAPGHSMETTLTINLPPRPSVRSGGASDQPQLKKEPKDKSISKKGGDHKAHNVSYKDKFQKMREKYDKVTLAHENHNRDLELLNSKIKKLQAENDLLLDSIYVSDPDLFTRYFPVPSSSGHGVSLPPGQATNYTSTMPPPAPPMSAASSSATGTTTISQQPSMPPPFPPMPMVPPPASATSNGTTNSSSTTARPTNSHSHSHSHSSSRRQSIESSSQGGRVPTERRRRGDAHSHGGGPVSTPRTPTQAHRSASGVLNDERDMRSPRTNGTGAQPRSPMTAMPVGAGVSMPMNGLRSPQSHRRQSDVIPQPPMMMLHEDDILAERERERERERDAHDVDTYRREAPPMTDDGGYSAYAAVNSPDEEEEEDDNARGKMDMDA